MAEHQIVGDQQPLDRKVTDPPTHQGPNPNAQLVGDNVPLNRSAVYPPTHTLKQGQTDMVGDSVALPRNATQPFGNHDALPESTLANYPAGRGRK